jgi:hypothetical protein
MVAYRFRTIDAILYCTTYTCANESRETAKEGNSNAAVWLPAESYTVQTNTIIMIIFLRVLPVIFDKQLRARVVHNEYRFVDCTPLLTYVYIANAILLHGIIIRRGLLFLQE